MHLDCDCCIQSACMEGPKLVSLRPTFYAGFAENLKLPIERKPSLL